MTGRCCPGMDLPPPDPAHAPARPACVNPLHIAGRKTFTDPVTLDILPGLNGPNGCGKSNVVDARRWAMGQGNACTLCRVEMERT